MELKIAGDQQVDRVYTLYLAAFPEAERKPFSRIEQTCCRGDGEMLALMEGEEFQGLAITVFYRDLVLLDYFAVEPDCRGQGVGGQALKLLLLRCAGRRFFLEIETTKKPSENQEQRLRRKAFYLRSGLREIGMSVMLGGVEMEVLTDGCRLDYDEYQALYQTVYPTIFGDHESKRIWQIKE